MARSQRRESAIEATIVRYARECGIWTRKFASPAHRGLPDRIFMKHGVVLFLEVKRQGEKPTPLQLHEIADIIGHGGSACWCDSVAEGTAVLNTYFNLL